VPEGDTIFRAARTLKAALASKAVTRFETVLPYLARVHEDTPITGRVVEDVASHGKWMEMRFSGDLILLTHMLMSGSWHIYRPGEKWQRRRVDMRIVIGTESIEAVAFNVPVAEFHTTESLARRPGFNRLGEDVLGAGFSEDGAVTQLKSRPDLELGEALLNQSLLAGIGNVFKSELAFACCVNPYRKIASLNEDELLSLARTARTFLQANVRENSKDGIVTYTGFRRTTGRANPTDRLWVYGRAGQPCRKCGTPIRMQKQGPGARVTFWCPNCQR
jgi:endonuclease VIII